MKDLYIITGAKGFLASHIISDLSKKEDITIRALVKKETYKGQLDKYNCKIYYGDVTAKDSLKELFSNTQNYKSIYVIHCAAIIYIKNKKNPNVYNVNVNGTKNIINYVKKIKAKFIYISSVHAIPPKPNNEVMSEITKFDPNKVVGIYAKTKAIAANYVMDMFNKKEIEGCILQPSGIIGPEDYGYSYMTELIKQLILNRLPAIVDGAYNFVDVRDVSEAVINACTKSRNGECYILTNRTVTVKELSKLVSKYSGAKEVTNTFPMWFIKLVAPLCELYYDIRKQKPLFTSYSLYTLGVNSNFSNDKARKELNFKPRDIKETIKDIVNWLQKENI